VFTQFRPTVAAGDSVTVTGDVQEFRPGGTGSTNLTTTELSRPEITVVGHGVALPAETLVGPGGRVPPSAVIENDTTGDGTGHGPDNSVETSGAFDPATDGIDFWESMEGMRVGIVDAQVVGPTSNFGELPVVPMGSEARTERDGIVIAPDDFNPERVLLDDVLAKMPAANTGDSLAGTTVGVLDYSFGNYKLLPSQTPTVVPGGTARETATPAGRKEFAIATYNVENLDPTDPQSKFDALADQITHNLGGPDVVALEEVQDNDGPSDTGTTAADKTLGMLTQAIKTAGGPSYDWRQIDPVNDEEGGEPGGNIRVAFLFRTDRGVQFVDRGTPTGNTPAAVFTDEDGNAHLQTSPARIAPDSPAWADSRVPLVGEFRWNGRTFFVIANHFASKGGDDPLFGRWQPTVRSSEVKRHQQAHEVRSFVDQILAADPDARVAVLGDLNDFQFSETADILVGSGSTRLTDLPRTLPADQQYSYVFEGNSQVLDHMLLSPRFVKDGYAYDIVHVNAEFADQTSDHDPQVVRLGIPNQFQG
jgi:predicted extracellular nuclease